MQIVRCLYNWQLDGFEAAFYTEAPKILDLLKNTVFHSCLFTYDESFSQYQIKQMWLISVSYWEKK